MLYNKPTKQCIVIKERFSQIKIPVSCSIVFNLLIKIKSSATNQTGKNIHVFKLCINTAVENISEQTTSQRSRNTPHTIRIGID